MYQILYKHIGEKAIPALWVLLIIFLFGQCSGQKSQDPPGVLRAEEIPAWIQEHQLVFPNSIAYSDEGRFVFKTAFRLEQIEKYYTDTLERQKFTIIEKVNRPQALLLLARRDKSVIAVEISKLIYSDNHLIRLGLTQSQLEEKVAP